jgi:uncharacterized membrane protein
MRQTGRDLLTTGVSTDTQRDLVLGVLVISLGLGVVLTGVPSFIIPATGASAEYTATEEPFGQTEIDADSILMAASVDSTGDADWRVVYRLQLDDSDSVTGFEELQADIENDTAAYLDPFEERIQRTVQSARNTTDREMVADGFTMRTERDSQPDAEFGLVIFEFEWRGFALVEDDGATIRAGDAVDRLFLEDGTNFRVRWPDEYQLQSHTPTTESVSEGRVTWNGPIDFDSGEPRVVLTTGETTTSPTTTDGDDGTATQGGDGTATQDGDRTQTPEESGPDESESDGGPSMLLFGLAVIVVLVAAAVAVAMFRRRETPDGETTEPAKEQEADSGDEATGPPPELLSNEERVLQLLEQEGGRVKQKTVAEQLDWTAAKTSQVVGDLRDEDKVEAFRLGRENVLTLPDVDLEDSTESSEESDEDGQ